MVKLTKTQLGILKEVIKVFSKYAGFAFSGNTFCIDNQKLYFQTPHFTVELKIPILETPIQTGKVLVINTEDLEYYLCFIDNRSIRVTTSINQRICLDTNSGYRQAYTVRDFLPQHEAMVIKKHGTRVYKLLSSDISKVKLAVDFAHRFNEFDGSYQGIGTRNVCISDTRVFATDNYFGYMSPALRSDVPDGNMTLIPRAICNIIKHCDSDIIVRESDELMEFDNDYFTIYYNKPTRVPFPVSEFYRSAADIITVNKKELINSLRILKRSFSGDRARTKSIKADLTVTVNGVFDLKPMRGDGYSRVSSFSRSFSEDLTFNTFGNRFLKILSTIKENEIKLRIPRGARGGGIIINDTYLLMSFMEWI